MNRKTHRNDEGVALLVAIIFVTVAGMILGALAMRVVQQGQQTTQYKIFGDSFPVMEAGVAAAWADLENGGSGNIGLGTWAQVTTDEILDLPTFDDTGVSPLTMTTMPSIQYIAFTNAWETDGIDNDNNGTVDDVGETDMFTIYGFADNQGVRRGLEVVMGGSDVNVWRNAIFAGSGQAGGLINGNVAIHGSVHLLGDNTVSNTTVLAAVDLSGTALIHNNYVGMPASLSGRIPALTPKNVNGEMVETLSAKLRVKRGLVGMSGNSEIGEPDVTGNTIKETMDGTFVTDGWTGTSVTDDGGRGDPTNVFSDNGWDKTYDLGNRVHLPVFSDPYVEVGTGNTYTDPDTGSLYTYESYWTKVLASTAYNGDMTIKANQNFYWNAQRPTDTYAMAGNRLSGEDYILFDAATNKMEISGQVKINGNFAIERGSGNDKTINYTGRAAILVNGDATLDTNLYSVNSDGTTANSFPVNNIFGIMTTGSLTMGVNSQLELMGAFYASQQIKSTKQTIVTGTYVSNYFDMGTNVPEIYQVPTLADNLPLGMIGAGQVLVYEQISWREIAAA
ncbi:MAG: hypothetical protein HUU46_12145 [Candidatus Hydrogenedentes bacterium]|nr:hypothetical protein [Candidatus Hydrogenedentota bacterium]